VLVQIGGIVERFPSLGIDGAPFVVAHGPRLLRLLNASFFRPATPNELWLRLPGDPAVIEQVRTTDGIGTLLLQTATLHSFSRDPLAVGIAGVFFLGFVTSVGLTALGFAVATYLAGRRRMVEFAVLQALGLSQRAVLLILAMEQAVLVTLALLAGTVLGIVLGRLIVPLMAIGDRGRAVVPPYQIMVPWGTLATTYLVLVVVFGVTTVLVLALLLRRGIGSALRTGEG
jgi:ABC-type antimicrobial peptide transport system permease subunit